MYSAGKYHFTWAIKGVRYYPKFQTWRVLIYEYKGQRCCPSLLFKFSICGMPGGRFACASFISRKSETT